MHVQCNCCTYQDVYLNISCGTSSWHANTFNQQESVALAISLPFAMTSRLKVPVKFYDLHSSQRFDNDRV